MTMAAVPCLLVRHDVDRQDEAIIEIRTILQRAGEPDAIVRPSGVPGSLKVIPEGDAHEAQIAVRSVLERSPSLFHVTSHWCVVDEFVPADLDAIRHACAPLGQRLGATDSWRLAMPNPTGPYPQADIFDAVAPLIQNAPVDQDNPEKQIVIDFVGKQAAVGLVGPGEAFDVPREDDGLDVA